MLVGNSLTQATDPPDRQPITNHREGRIFFSKHVPVHISVANHIVTSHTQNSKAVTQKPIDHFLPLCCLDWAQLGDPEALQLMKPPREALALSGPA